MGDEKEKRDCLLNGCPNVDHVKETVMGKMNMLIKISAGILLFLAGTFVTVSIWASDKKDIQETKITKMESKLDEHDGHWDEQHIVNKALLETMDGLKSYMIEQKTIQHFLHPELKDLDDG